MAAEDIHRRHTGHHLKSILDGIVCEFAYLGQRQHVTPEGKGQNRLVGRGKLQHLRLANARRQFRADSTDSILHIDRRGIDGARVMKLGFHHAKAGLARGSHPGRAVDAGDLFLERLADDFGNVTGRRTRVWRNDRDNGRVGIGKQAHRQCQACIQTQQDHGD